MGSVAKTMIGKPCRKCGGTSRYVASGACDRCHRERERVRTGGLTIAERDRMLKAQGGACPICGTRTVDGNGWHLDHDHRFAQNDPRGHRGMLCNRCNPMLGYALDNEATLINAAEYLRRWRLRSAA